ncbi:hypothetical protein P3T76_003927 [Phytophthora citrophthora]|uniref:Uncharacterized protein n=1 Tax=Phytophthora citrophthora TaxID=4793 RepID=A0AAD9GVK8_9STRA|nr:hypothetical protein P3T76_003927 [Phytophthora citrophthora]
MHHPVDTFVHSDPEDSKLQWYPSITPLVSDDKQRLAVKKDMSQRERIVASDVESVWDLYPELKKKHHDRQNPGESGEAEAVELHEIFVHTDEDTIENETAPEHGSQHRRFGQSLVRFLDERALSV